MPILDGKLFDTQIATATLTALSPVDSVGDKVKDLPPAFYSGVIGFSANCQYLTIHNQTTFGGIDPGEVIDGRVKTGSQRQFEKYIHQSSQQAVKDSQYIIKGYQDSGGNENVQAILYHVYGKGRSVPLATAKGNSRGRIITKGANLTANAWTSIAAVSDVEGDLV